MLSYLIVMSYAFVLHCSEEVLSIPITRKMLFRVDRILGLTMSMGADSELIMMLRRTCGTLIWKDEIVLKRSRYQRAQLSRS